MARCCRSTARSSPLQPIRLSCVPLIFPGGTIGDLAIYGTVNDLAMCGARPLYLSAGFILEEGLEMETLRTVVTSMQAIGGQGQREAGHRRHEGRRQRKG